MFFDPRPVEKTKRYDQMDYNGGKKIFREERLAPSSLFPPSAEADAVRYKTSGIMSENAVKELKNLGPPEPIWIQSKLPKFEFMVQQVTSPGHFTFASLENANSRGVSRLNRMERGKISANLFFVQTPQLPSTQTVEFSGAQQMLTDKITLLLPAGKTFAELQVADIFFVVPTPTCNPLPEEMLQPRASASAKETAARRRLPWEHEPDPAEPPPPMNRRFLTTS
eukprot:TRINITY_DN2696_c0_g1_i1.p1 TRINITY_DN2696_c0_g1~~TRINITY_DN2696_c0_g1_i1.p1  ORF type:complete len:245 (-),score=25.03 TRINITY_DN2696_c0_g1_i1:4-675(-)